MRMAVWAARRDESVLDNIGGKLEINKNPFGGDKLSLVDKEGRSIRGAANLIATLPSRLLLFSDEFFKQATYRGKLKADLWVAGRNKGYKGFELEQYIKLGERRAFTDTGAAVALDPHSVRTQAIKDAETRGLTGKDFDDFVRQQEEFIDNSKHSLDIAREATFTTELSGMSARVQALAVEYPSIRFILPFVKTPTNLLLAAGRRAPILNIASKKMMADLKSPNPSIRAQATGKFITGWAVTFTAGALAFSGQITGSGPSNPQTRRALMATGWRPYSRVIINEDGSKSYQSYHRFDPFSNFFGVAATMVELMNEAKLEGKKGAEDAWMDIGTGLLMAVADNSINKTYLRGLSDFMGAVTAADKNMERFLASTMVSYTPAAIGQLNGDGMFRETQGILDQVKARMMTDLGTGLNAAPRRNQLGEIVYRGQDKWHPFSQSDRNPNDTVLNELSHLAHLTGKNFGLPSDKRMGTKTDFSQIMYKDGQSVFDRFLELTGSDDNKLGGKTLRETLATYIPLLQSVHPGTRDDPDGPRSKAIGKIFSQFRKTAKMRMYAEGSRMDAPEGLKRFSAELNLNKREKARLFAQRGEYNLEAMIHQMIKGR